MSDIDGWIVKIKVRLKAILWDLLRRLQEDAPDFHQISVFGMIVMHINKLKISCENESQMWSKFDKIQDFVAKRRVSVILLSLNSTVFNIARFVVPLP